MTLSQACWRVWVGGCMYSRGCRALMAHTEGTGPPKPVMMLSQPSIEHPTVDTNDPARASRLSQVGGCCCAAVIGK